MVLTQESAQKLALHYGLQPDEYRHLSDRLGRIPHNDEMAVCGALWSEHCSYKSSRIHLKRLHTQEPWVLQGPGENAGIVAVNENWGIAFKMESHNHPSYIEPYQGAATGVGGILRDVFCMGARPIANINCLRYGSLVSKQDWNAHCLKETVRGIGDYGNSVGVPTVTGDTSFHDGYKKNILINAFTAGLIHKDRIFRGVVTSVAGDSAEGNLLVYFGSATGRDGVHGATMSSSEFSASGQSLRPTVQVGDPFAEKVLLEATLHLLNSGLIVGLQDMGAAGLVSSSAEMAARSGCGVALELDSVPQRAADMRSWEILLSESQERMLCSVKPQKLNPLLAMLETFDLHAAVIGKVTNTGRFVCTYRGETCVDLPLPILVEDSPRYEWPIEPRDQYLAKQATIRNSNGGTHPSWHQRIREGISMADLLKGEPTLVETLALMPNFASREPIYSHYCATVQANTVAGVGALQDAAAAVVRLPQEAQTSPSAQAGIALAAGCEERWVQLDPLHGSALSILKSARKIASVGGNPLALTDCMNFGSPKNPAVMRQFSDAIDAMTWIGKELHIPVVSGNVSLNNQTDSEPIPPTPMIGMVGTVADVRRVPKTLLSRTHRFNTAASAENGGRLTLIHLSAKQGVAASSYDLSLTSWLLGGENRGPVAKPDLAQERAEWKCLAAAVDAGILTLAAPVSHGGLLGRIVKLALENRATAYLLNSELSRPARQWFAEGSMGYLVAVESARDLERLTELAKRASLDVTTMGYLVRDDLTTTGPLKGESATRLDLSKLYPSWRSSIDVWNLRHLERA
jgi:phosphoribosylformylglycinamidine synthase